MKASQNQPNGFVECSIRPQPSPFQKTKTHTNASSLALELLAYGFRNICEGCVVEGLFNNCLNYLL